MRNSFFVVLLILSSCQNKNETHNDLSKEKEALHSMLNNWHKAASEANFDAYFSKMDSLSVFIGTDASENWDKRQFEDFSRPYFENGKAWSFTAAQRNIYLSEKGDFAWFDELLNTWMGACRGSGVLKKQGNEWKLKHYVLSVTVPNEDIKKLIDIKSKKDSIYLRSLSPKL